METLRCAFSSLQRNVIVAISLALKRRRAGVSLVVTLSKKPVEEKRIRAAEIVEIAIKKTKKDGFGILGE